MDAKPSVEMYYTISSVSTFGEAYAKVVGMEIAIKGFRDTGMRPVDSVFREKDFS